MQTKEAKPVNTEKLSLGALIVILMTTNVFVFVALSPYAS
jgi:hypothetical protein